MGYFYNHLATLVTGVFAAVLTGLWPLFVGLFPILNFVFLMAVPISWFLVFTCWISQRSADYMKKYEAAHSHHEEKKSLTKQISSSIYTSEGKLANAKEIKDAKSELTQELNTLRNTLKLKDSEIFRLKQEIANLETLVQIESLKSELAKLKALASERKGSKSK